MDCKSVSYAFGGLVDRMGLRMYGRPSARDEFDCVDLWCWDERQELVYDPLCGNWSLWLKGSGGLKWYLAGHPPL